MTEQSITTGAIKSFKDLLNPNKIYVDKTGYVCELAKSDEQFLLTRPRRMGKSTMVATLEHLFSQGAFSGEKSLAWDGKWTDPYRYFVFHFDWSNFKWKSAHDLEFSFLSSLHVYAKYFGISLATNITVGEIFRAFILDCLAKLSEKEFLSAHSELTITNGANDFCPDKIVLLIDEYDSPLTKSLSDPKLFNELREVYSEIYSTIKSINCFRFVFITGVSSYAQTSIFSGPNQFENVSLYDEYATCCGYTRAEIEHNFGDELDRAQQVLKLDSREQLLDKLCYHYDGYVFSDKEASYDANMGRQLRVFSPVSVSSFLKRTKQGFKSYWPSTGGSTPFLFKLLKFCNKTFARQLIRSLYPTYFILPSDLEDELSEAIASYYPIFCLTIDSTDPHQTHTQFLKVNFCDLFIDTDDVENLVEDNAIAILFQAGYLSIKKVKGKIAYLGLPNHDVARALTILLQEQLEEQEDEEGKEPLSAVDLHILYLLKHSQEVLNSLHQVGQTLCNLINNTYYCIDKKI